MFENFILGMIQGIFEWLPVSSEGILVLVKTNFFPPQVDLAYSVKLALFLHFGTTLSALLYFHKDVKELFISLFKFKDSDVRTQRLLKFIVVTTIISGAIGFVVLELFSNIITHFESTGRILNLVIGCALLITGYLDIKSKIEGNRGVRELHLKDSIVLGIIQGFAVIPGLSRSGLTISALLLRNVEKTQALELSFLMSLPLVLAGNLILNSSRIEWTLPDLAGLFASFLFGLITIHMLLKLAQRVKFGAFVLFFGIIVILATFI